MAQNISPYSDDPYRYHGGKFTNVHHNDDAACRTSATQAAALAGASRTMLGGGGGSATVDLTALEALQQQTIDCLEDLKAKPDAAFPQPCCMVDDVNGDGTLLVPYIAVQWITVTGGVLTSAPLGNFTDGKLETPYTVLGAGILAEQVGEDAILQVDSELLTGTTFSPSALTRSYSIRVVDATGVTFTGSNGVTRGFVANEVFDVNAEGYTLDPAATFTIGASGQVFLTHTYLGA